MQTKSLTQKTFSGVLWNFGEQVARKGIQGIVTLVLAYFLIPEDFGLVAMLAIFIALGQSLTDSGFKHALIRLDNATQDDFNTAFYSNILLGGLSYTLLFLLAPLIANFYDEPKLVDLIRVVAIMVVINSFQVVQVAKISREMLFRVLLSVNLPAAAISGVGAVILAYYGFGVWALIFQMVLSSLLLTLFLWFKRIWRPSLSVSKKSFVELYRFGYKLFLSDALVRIVQNFYVVIIAKYFSVAIAGYYFFADKIKELLVMQLVTALQNVTYPALSQLKNDDVRLKEAYRKVVKTMTFVLFPVTLFASSLAEVLFEAVLPEKWWDAAFYLQMMLIASVLIPIHAINLNILNVKGRSDLFLYLEAIKAVLLLSILSISMQFGITEILLGQIVFSIIAYVPNSYFSAKLINYSIKEQIYDFLPALLLSSVIALGIYNVQVILNWHPIWELLVLGSLAAIVYLIGAFLMKLDSLLLVKALILKKM